METKIGLKCQNMESRFRMSLPEGANTVIHPFSYKEEWRDNFFTGKNVNYEPLSGFKQKHTILSYEETTVPMVRSKPAYRMDEH
jgi:hypothetical protein